MTSKEQKILNGFIIFDMVILLTALILALTAVVAWKIVVVILACQVLSMNLSKLIDQIKD